MYLIKPEACHKDAVLDFVSRCREASDKVEDIFDLESQAEAMHQADYEAWLKLVQANQTAVVPTAGNYVVPGYTMLLVEHADPTAQVSEEYLGQFPMLSKTERLVGIVSIHSSLRAGDGGNSGVSGQLRLTLVPCYRDLVNYMLSFADVLTYAVCEGLPYKFLVYRNRSGDGSSDLSAALSNCNFDYRMTDSTTGEDIYWVDLRVAHQLRERISEFDRREG